MEIRNIYPGECLFADDVRVLRVQTFGASSTLNSDDIHELGNKEKVDSVDGIPTVAITLDTFEYSTLMNECLLSEQNPYTTRFVDLPDYENAKVDMYAPIIKGEDYGKTNASVAAGDLTIYRTMYIEDAFVTAINHTYNVSGTATENYTLESDNKAWLWGAKASVNVAEYTISTGVTDYDLVSGINGTTGILASGAVPGIVATQLDDGSYTLGYGSAREKIVEVIDSNGIVVASLVWEENVAEGSPATPSVAGYFVVVKETSVQPGGKDGGKIIRLHATDATTYDGKTLKIRFAASDKGAYFTPDSSKVAGIRHGQVQIYLAPTLNDYWGVSKVKMDDSEIYWRLQSATANATLGREALSELGHFRPYARPLTFPIPVTVTVESIDSDTMLFAKLCGKDFASDAESSIDDLLKSLNLVIKIYKYDDIMRQKIYAALKEAGKNTDGYNAVTTGYNEVTSTLPAYGGTGLDDTAYISGVPYYSHDLAPLKLIIVKKLIATAENQNLGVGGNATQTFDFKSDNLAEGIGAASSLCLGSNGVNEGYVVDNEEIEGVAFTIYAPGSAVLQTWQAFKFGIVDNQDTSDI